MWSYSSEVNGDRDTSEKEENEAHGLNTTIITTIIIKIIIVMHINCGPFFNEEQIPMNFFSFCLFRKNGTRNVPADWQGRWTR